MIPDKIDFDAIVVGSGITGGWAAKELTEQGLKVLMVERGPPIEHVIDYKKEFIPPWKMPFRGFGDAQRYKRDYPIWRSFPYFNEWTEDHFVKDREHPYQSEADPFLWHRSYQLGGRSLVWGRQCYRLSDLDFAANKKDGYGVDWPIRYADMAPWYDKIEDFIGVSGANDGLSQLPDGHFQPPMAMNAVEAHLKRSIESTYADRRVIMGRSAHLTRALDGQARAVCQYRNICARGCSYGAYFSTQSSTLPAARATGNLTVLTDTLCEELEYDAATQRATGVRVRHLKTGVRTAYRARVIFLCASTLNTVAILLRSASKSFPNGLGNSSGTLGRYLMDHATSLSALAFFPGFDDRSYFGNRPIPILIPRFRNVADATPEFVRGYQLNGFALRRGWKRGASQAGIGRNFKQRLRSPGEWLFVLATFAECLPRAENRVTLHPTARDPEGLAQLSIAFKYGENERRLIADAAGEAKTMMQAAGGLVAASGQQPDPGGSAIHEMGGARMGHDPRTSVLNGFNQAHDVKNLFITDGAAMTSSACQNPSLTYMALTARACSYAVEQLRNGAL